MKKTFFLLTLSLLPLFAFSQKLGEIKDAVRSGASNEGRNNNNNNSIWIDLLFNLAWEPTWWLLFRGPNEMPANYLEFNDYPYADGENGLYLPPDYFADKPMSLQLTAHLQTDQDAVYGGFFQAKWSPNRAITLDVNHLQLLETLDDATGTGSRTDHFAMTNFNLAYNRVRHSKFQLWWGAGLMLLNGGNSDVLYGSPSFNAGLTWYFKKPLSLYADTQIGAPNGAFARQNQVRMQMHLKQFMVYAGYQGVKVGNVGLPSVSVGTGVWF